MDTDTSRPRSRELVDSLYSAYRADRVLEPGPDLRGHVLGSVDLPGARMHRLDLMGATLTASRLSRTTLDGVDLTAARLAGVDLSGARLVGCTLRSADLRRARLEGATIEGSDLRGATLAGAHMAGVHILGALLTDADARAVDLTRARIRESVLTNSDLRKALLAEVLMSDCVTRGARLEGARLFHRTRALIAEVLLQEAEGDLERLAYIAAVRERTDLCWDAWRRIADQDPFGHTWAQAVFSRYPESGMLESLREGRLTLAESAVER